MEGSGQAWNDDRGFLKERYPDFLDNVCKSRIVEWGVGLAIITNGTQSCSAALIFASLGRKSGQKLCFFVTDDTRSFWTTFARAGWMGGDELLLKGFE